MNRFISVPITLTGIDAKYPVELQIDSEKQEVAAKPAGREGKKLSIGYTWIDLTTGALLTELGRYSSQRIDLHALSELRNILQLPPLTEELIDHIEKMDLSMEEFMSRYPIEIGVQMTVELHSSLKELDGYPEIVTEVEPIGINPT